MNKHIAPYERVSHFIALISSGSHGVSCEQWRGNSRSSVLLRRDGRCGSATPTAMKGISSLLRGRELWRQTWVSSIGAKKTKAGKPPPPINIRRGCVWWSIELKLGSPRSQTRSFWGKKFTQPAQKAEHIIALADAIVYV